MVHGKISPVTRARTQWRHAEHVGDELKCVSVPGEDHRARSRQPLCFRNVQRFPALLARFVLYQPVRPRDANRVYVCMPVRCKRQRHSIIDALAVEYARLHFHGCIDRVLEIFHALNPNHKPALVRRGVCIDMKRTVGQYACIIFALIAIEICANSGWRRFHICTRDQLARVVPYGK